MLIDKIRKHVERIVYIRKPYTGVMEGIFIVDPKKRDQAVDVARCLEQHAVEMAQALIAVDGVLEEVEKIDNLMPKEEEKEYHAIIVAKIRQAIEPTRGRREDA